MRQAVGHLLMVESVTTRRTARPAAVPATMPASFAPPMLATFANSCDAKPGPSAPRFRDLSNSGGDAQPQEYVRDGTHDQPQPVLEERQPDHRARRCGDQAASVLGGYERKVHEAHDAPRGPASRAARAGEQPQEEPRARSAAIATSPFIAVGRRRSS